MARGEPVRRIRRPKAGTSVLISFLAILALLSAVIVTSTVKLGQLGKLAGDLNEHLVTKTRLANDIVELGQQIRFADAFLLESTTEAQDELVKRIIADRTQLITGKIATYEGHVDSDEERDLLSNVDRSRANYLAAQAAILAVSPSERTSHSVTNEIRLTARFADANRKAMALAKVSDAQAREARKTAADIASHAPTLILGVAGLAGLIGIFIIVLLQTTIFRPLSRITAALTSLSKGRLEAAVTWSGRGDEIDAMAKAFETFRQNAIALATAHEEARTAHQLADSLARHDALTGLPNRRVLGSAVGRAIAQSGVNGLDCGVLVLDLDRFKPVNDIYGHGAGDKVLCEVAARLGKTVRSGEMAARLGGDEFAVVMEFEPGADVPVRLARRLIAAIEAPIAIDGTMVSVGASIGIALWPSDGATAEELLHAADLAMFKAKRNGRNGFSFFEPDMETQLRARAERESRIRQAIERDEVRPHYQALFDLRHDRLLGFEILARWHDGPVVVPPDEFIPLIEDAGLVTAFTASVLRQACRDVAQWPTDLTLALNVTPAQISDLQLPGMLLGILEAENFPPERLELEVTESALIGNTTAAKTVIGELRDRGIRISLDDFGTGYSSLNHLRDLRFDKIKIDRSFVQSLFDNQESATIVETIIGLGRNLNMSTVAEGIEDAEHLAALMGFGCEFGQGYHFSKPLSAGLAGELIAKLRAPVPTVEAAE